MTELRSARDIWAAALGELQIQISKANYRTWLEKTTGLIYQDNQFVISVPNTFIAEYLDRNQRSLIEKTLIGLLTSPEVKVLFQVNGRYPNGAGADAASTPSLWPCNFNSRYFFNSFVVGKSNHLAYEAAQKVAEQPGGAYNPLFIYGGSGLGKTHLLHAIGHAALASHAQVLCVSAEQFTNEFISALRERKTEDFRAKYRNLGMLLIDDIHFISGKEQTEESFFHTFNELHNTNRQIVITSNQSPQAIRALPDRLRTRLEWGLVADIQPPDLPTRLSIWEAKARQKDVTLGPEVLEFIAQKAPQNIRELEGSLNRVIAYAQLFRTAPTLELAAQALENITEKKSAVAAITPATVIAAVANSFTLTPDDLRSDKRDKETTCARRVAMYLLRQETNCSVTQIGQELGRDASAVTNACKKIAGEMETNPYLKRKVQEIQQLLTNGEDPAKS